MMPVVATAAEIVISPTNVKITEFMKCPSYRTTTPKIAIVPVVNSDAIGSEPRSSAYGVSPGCKPRVTGQQKRTGAASAPTLMPVG
jgi:hypothetical protein